MAPPRCTRSGGPTTPPEDVGGGSDPSLPYQAITPRGGKKTHFTGNEFVRFSAWISNFKGRENLVHAEGLTAFGEKPLKPVRTQDAAGGSVHVSAERNFFVAMVAARTTYSGPRVRT